MIWAVGVENHPRRRTILAAAVAAVGLFAAKGAWADQALVDLQVIDRDTGQVMQAWRHAGRLFIAGEPGRRYGLRVTNNTGGRVLAVLSVDGVNIVSGETAGYNQRGYILAPYGSTNVYGWRKSTTEIAAFSFAPLPQSYAARTGRPGDVGVIGMAIFEERLPPPPSPPVVSRALPLSARARSTTDASTIPPLPVPPVEHRIEQPRPPSAAPAPALGAATVAASPPSEKLGTAHGESERSFATLVSFERATLQPRMTLQIEYDTYANLAAAGVVPAPPRSRNRPQPFPSERSGFVPDPPRGF
jgi:hypothetical protein